MKEGITRRYLAGLLDGEGYFGIMNMPTDQSHRFYYRPTIKMALTNLEVLKEICLKLGGHIHERHFDNDSWKDAYCWESRTFTQTDKVLLYVHDYLIIKRPQADVLREFLDTKFKVSDNRGSTPLPNEILEKRRRLYYLMKKLNHKGKPPAETKRDAPHNEGEAIVRPSGKSEDVMRNLHTVAI